MNFRQFQKLTVQLQYRTFQQLTNHLNITSAKPWTPIDTNPIPIDDAKEDVKITCEEESNKCVSLQVDKPDEKPIEVETREDHTPIQQYITPKPSVIAQHGCTRRNVAAYPSISRRDLSLSVTRSRSTSLIHCFAKRSYSASSDTPYCPEPPSETEEYGLPYYYKRVPVESSLSENSEPRYEMKRYYFMYPGSIGKRPLVPNFKTELKEKQAKKSHADCIKELVRIQKKLYSEQKPFNVKMAPPETIQRKESDKKLKKCHSSPDLSGTFQDTIPKTKSAPSVTPDSPRKLYLKNIAAIPNELKGSPQPDKPTKPEKKPSKNTSIYLRKPYKPPARLDKTRVEKKKTIQVDTLTKGDGIEVIHASKPVLKSPMGDAKSIEEKTSGVEINKSKGDVKTPPVAQKTGIQETILTGGHRKGFGQSTVNVSKRDFPRMLAKLKSDKKRAGSVKLVVKPRPAVGSSKITEKLNALLKNAKTVDKLEVDEKEVKSVKNIETICAGKCGRTSPFNNASIYRHPRICDLDNERTFSEQRTVVKTTEREKHSVTNDKNKSTETCGKKYRTTSKKLDDITDIPLHSEHSPISPVPHSPIDIIKDKLKANDSPKDKHGLLDKDTYWKPTGETHSRNPLDTTRNTLDATRNTLDAARNDATKNTQDATRYAQDATRNAQDTNRNEQDANRNAQDATRNAQDAARNVQGTIRNADATRNMVGVDKNRFSGVERTNAGMNTVETNQNRFGTNQNTSDASRSADSVSKVKDAFVKSNEMFMETITNKLKSKEPFKDASKFVDIEANLLTDKYVVPSKKLEDFVKKEAMNEVLEYSKIENIQAKLKEIQEELKLPFADKIEVKVDKTLPMHMQGHGIKPEKGSKEKGDEIEISVTEIQNLNKKSEIEQPVEISVTEIKNLSEEDEKNIKAKHSFNVSLEEIKKMAERRNMKVDDKDEANVLMTTASIISQLSSKYRNKSVLDDKLRKFLDAEEYNIVNDDNAVYVEKIDIEIQPDKFVKSIEISKKAISNPGTSPTPVLKPKSRTKSFSDDSSKFKTNLKRSVVGRVTVDSISRNKFDPGVKKINTTTPPSLAKTTTNPKVKTKPSKQPIPKLDTTPKEVDLNKTTKLEVSAIKTSFNRPVTKLEVTQIKSDVRVVKSKPKPPEAKPKIDRPKSTLHQKPDPPKKLDATKYVEKKPDVETTFQDILRKTIQRVDMTGLDLNPPTVTEKLITDQYGAVKITSWKKIKPIGNMKTFNIPCEDYLKIIDIKRQKDLYSVLDTPKNVKLLQYDEPIPIKKEFVNPKPKVEPPKVPEKSRNEQMQTVMPHLHVEGKNEPRPDPVGTSLGGNIPVYDDLLGCDVPANMGMTVYQMDKHLPRRKKSTSGFFHVGREVRDRLDSIFKRNPSIKVDKVFEKKCLKNSTDDKSKTGNESKSTNEIFTPLTMSMRKKHDACSNTLRNKNVAAKNDVYIEMPDQLELKTSNTPRNSDYYLKVENTLYENSLNELKTDQSYRRFSSGDRRLKASVNKRGFGSKAKKAKKSKRNKCKSKKSKKKKRKVKTTKKKVNCNKIKYDYVVDMCERRCGVSKQKRRLDLEAFENTMCPPSVCIRKMKQRECREAQKAAKSAKKQAKNAAKGISCKQEKQLDACTLRCMEKCKQEYCKRGMKPLKRKKKAKKVRSVEEVAQAAVCVRKCQDTMKKMKNAGRPHKSKGKKKKGKKGSKVSSKKKDYGKRKMSMFTDVHINNDNVPGELRKNLLAKQLRLMQERQSKGFHNTGDRTDSVRTSSRAQQNRGVRKLSSMASIMRMNKPENEQTKKKLLVEQLKKLQNRQSKGYHTIEKRGKPRYRSSFLKQTPYKMRFKLNRRHKRTRSRCECQVEQVHPEDRLCGDKPKVRCVRKNRTYERKMKFLHRDRELKRLQKLCRKRRRCTELDRIPCYNYKKPKPVTVFKSHPKDKLCRMANVKVPYEKLRPKKDSFSFVCSEENRQFQSDCTRNVPKSRAKARDCTASDPCIPYTPKRSMPKFIKDKLNKKRDRFNIRAYKITKKDPRPRFLLIRDRLQKTNRGGDWNLKNVIREAVDRVTAAGDEPCRLANKQRTW